MSKRKKSQSNSAWLTLIVVGSLAIFTLASAIFLRGQHIALLDPKGFIANEQLKLLLVSTGIMTAFAVIILFFIYFFAWRYREGNNKTVHDPSAGRSKLLIFTAWASPLLVCAVLISIMLPATQKLEPQKSIESSADELTVRVIAMRWKWLFLYPDQEIATLNYLQIPVDTPIRFELTADEAPMNSFWIPNLGGMLYSMTEHVNPLNLIADTIGEYEGGAAEVNGRGFAGMRFKTNVSSREDFDDWVHGVADSSVVLDETEYQHLLKPSEYVDAVTYHSPANQELFDNLLKKYSGTHTHYVPAHDSGGHH